MFADPSNSVPSAAASSSGSKRTCPGAASADGDRRVQPRHFHAGPNPTAPAASSSSGAAAAERPPLAERLYRHALESIFAFLERGEVVTALHVSRDWLGAVKSMASMECWLGSLDAPLSAVVDSAMARHFTQIGTLETRLKLDANSLWILARGMAHVRELTCDLSLSAQARGPFFFPAALQELDLDVQAPVTAAQVNTAIKGIGRLPLLDTLAIHLPAADPQISFAPLAAVPQLRDLSISWQSDGDFSDAQVDQLQSMPNLRRVEAKPMSPGLLRRLLRQPHALQWQKIYPLPNLDDETAECLGSLPSLTHLACWVQCSRFDFLQRLPNLNLVNFSWTPGPLHLEAARTESFLGGLRHCTQIRQMTLTDFGRLTAAHLADLLPRLPELQTLVLSSLQIDSLSFLAQQPTAQRLTHLALLKCRQLPLVELRHVHALRGLVVLSIDRSFAERMDSFCRSLHAPPSVALPQLNEFIYVEPGSDADDGANDVE